MKTMMTLCVSLVFLFSSCEKGTSVEPTDPKPEDPMPLALGDISLNQELLTKAYEELSIRLPEDTIKHLRKVSQTRIQFVRNMVQRTKGVFNEVVKSNNDSEAAKFFVKIEVPQDDNRLMELSRLFAGEQQFDDYAARILKDAGTGKKQPYKWVLIESYSYPDGSTLPIPKEQASVNYEQIGLAYELKDILISSIMTDEEQQETINELMLQAEIPPLFGALLLPAIQKYTAEPVNDPFMNWLNAEVNPAINGGLNRDIIRRMTAAGFLGGMEYFVSDAYDNDNQTSASLHLSRARFETTLVFLWNEIWNSQKVVHLL